MAALFTSLGNNSEWIKMWYIHTVEYYPPRKKNEMSFAAMWMNLEIITLSEVSQTKTNIVCHLYVESKKYDAGEFVYRTETEPQI